MNDDVSYVKRFSNKIRLSEFSRSKFVLSVFIGLISSVLFYLFLQYCFILIRSLNFGFLINPDYVLLPKTKYTIALSFATIAVGIGNAVGISHLFSGVSVNKKVRRIKRNILNDQSALTPTAIYWFLKIFSLFIGSILLSFASNLQKEYSYFVFFLVIVLILDQVKGLRRFLKDYTCTVMLYHFVLLGLTALIIALSTIDVYDLNESIEKRKSLFVTVPNITVSSSGSEKIFMHHRSSYLEFKVTKVDDTLKIYGWDSFLTLKEVQNEIMEDRRSHYQERAIFYIDKSLQWQTLEPLFEALILVNAQKISIVMIDSKTLNQVYYKHSIAYTKENYDKWILSSDIPLPRDAPPFFEDYTRDMIIDTLNIADFKSSKTTISDSIESYLYDTAASKTARILKIDDIITVQDYLHFIIGYKKGIYRLRERYTNHPRLQNGNTAVEEFPIMFKELIQ